MKRYSTLTLLLMLLAMAGCKQSAQQTDYTQYVNLMIGTGGHGHTHPAAVVPHGMIMPGPDTRIHEWDACSGYYHPDSLINGFAQTRLSGTGCADLGDFLIMPTTGKQDVSYVGEKDTIQNVAFASAFSHDSEVATPDYYKVHLDRYDIDTEITSTARAALYRFTFPESGDAGMILDLDYNIQDQTNLEMSYEVVNDTTVKAYKNSNWWEYEHKVYFYAVFSRPFTYDAYTDTIKTTKREEPRQKLLLHFGKTAKDEQVMMKVSISSVDHKGAEQNLTAEIPAWDFEAIHEAGVREWNKYLSRIDIKTDDADKRTIFYTGLYHAYIAPNLFQDVDGRYLGMDLKIHQGDKDDPMYTTFSLWDTFRALNPLYSILTPEQNEAFIRSLMKKGDEGGLIPKWDCGANYTGCMIGYHFVSLLTDAYVKGYRNYDAEKALTMALRCAEYDTLGITEACPKFLYPYIMPEARRYKAELGYVPCDKNNESVAKALEYAYNDYCIAVLADSLGQKDTADKYYGYSKLYKNYFDSETGYMRGKDSNGQWRTPFDPAQAEHRANDYCEGNAYQWSWFAPHDVEGLIELYGGREGFLKKLDALFSASSELSGKTVSADISGLIGQYAHGNEPSHHTIHLYNYAGQPEKTQDLVYQVLTTLYSNAPDGLSGNEDCGQMSAWYIMNAMGFYQVCPGKAVYSIGRPILDEATIHLPNGKDFCVKVTNASSKDAHIKSMKLNGKTLEKPFFTHEDMMKGGVLEIEF